MSELQNGFKSAMRGLASTVCVLAAQTPQGPKGMTATAVMSLSMEPPSLALAVNRSASIAPDLEEGAHVSVQFLSEGQAEVARAFAGGLPGYQRFACGRWEADAWGTPMLLDASASIACVIDKCIAHATHNMIIAIVKAVRLSQGMRPLLYVHGEFTRLEAQEGRMPA